MKTLQDIQQEAREELENRFVEVAPEESGGSRWKKNSNPDELPAFLDSLILRVADALQEVVPEDDELTLTECNNGFALKTRIQAAFKAFREGDNQKNV